MSQIQPSTRVADVQHLSPRKDYQSFRFIGSNRDIKEFLVESIAEDIDEINLLDLYPLVVDNDGRIFDGQHRHAAAAGMLSPFYTLADDDLEVADIARTNQATAEYSYADHLHVYCALGFEPYRRIREYKSRNPHLNIGKCIKLLNYGNSNAIHEFKFGTYKVTSLRFAELVSSRTLEFVAMFPEFAGTPYIGALAELSLHARYDHERMMNRLAAVPTRVKRVRKIDDAYEVLSSVYNYNTNASNRILLSRPKGETRIYPCREEMPIESPRLNLARFSAWDKSVLVEVCCDLSELKPHPASREILKTRVADLQKSVRQKNLLHLYPIICNTRNEVLDGNLRVQVAQNLGVPVYTIKTDDVSILHVVRASGKREEWRLPDYFKTHLNEGHPEYKKLQRLIGRNAIKESSLAVWVVVSSGTLGESKEDFKSGAYECRFPNFALWFMSRLETLLSIGVPCYLSVLSRCLANLLSDPRFDLDELVDKTQTHGVRLWEPFSNNDDGYGVVESVFNYRRRDKVAFSRSYSTGTFRDFAGKKERELRNGK